MSDHNQEILNRWMYVLPLLNGMLINDTGVCFTDYEKVFFYKHSKTLDLKIEVCRELAASL